MGKHLPRGVRQDKKFIENSKTMESIFQKSASKKSFKTHRRDMTAVLFIASHWFFNVMSLKNRCNAKI